MLLTRFRWPQVYPLTDYQLVSYLEDDTLRELQAFLAKVRESFGRSAAAELPPGRPPPTKNALHVREWRAAKRPGYVPQPRINWKYDQTCHRGHALTGRNVGVMKHGQRFCRTCLNTRVRIWRHERARQRT